MFTEEKLLEIYGSTIALNGKVESTEKEIRTLGDNFQKHAEKSNKHKEDMEKGLVALVAHVKALETRMLVGFAVIAGALKFSPEIIDKIVTMVSH